MNKRELLNEMVHQDVIHISIKIYIPIKIYILEYDSLKLYIR